jgi:hypothetical protein
VKVNGAPDINPGILRGSQCDSGLPVYREQQWLPDFQPHSLEIT